MAEREGFEPSIRCRIHTFQACAFDHSATSPWCESLAQRLVLGVKSSSNDPENITQRVKKLVKIVPKRAYHRETIEETRVGVA